MAGTTLASPPSSSSTSLSKSQGGPPSSIPKPSPSPSAAAYRRTIASTSGASTPASSSRSPSVSSSVGGGAHGGGAAGAGAAPSAIKSRTTPTAISPPSSRRSSHGAQSNSSTSTFGARSTSSAIPVRSHSRTVSPPSEPTSSTRSSRAPSSNLSHSQSAKPGRTPSASKAEGLAATGSASAGGSSTATTPSATRGSYFEMYYGAKGAKTGGASATAGGGGAAATSAATIKTASSAKTDSSRLTTAGTATVTPKAPITNASPGSAVRTARAARRSSGVPYTPILSNNSSRSSGSISHGSGSTSTTAHSSIPSSSSSSTIPSSPASSRASTGANGQASGLDSLLAPAPPSPPRSRLPVGGRSHAHESDLAAGISFPLSSAKKASQLTAAPSSTSSYTTTPSTSSAAAAGTFEPPASSGWKRVAAETKALDQRQYTPDVPSQTRTASTRTRTFASSSTRASPSGTSSNTSPAPLPLPPATKMGSLASSSAPRLQKVKEPVMSIDEIIRAHSASLKPVALPRSFGSGTKGMQGSNSSYTVSSASAKLSPIADSPALGYSLSGGSTPSASQPPTPKQPSPGGGQSARLAGSSPTSGIPTPAVSSRSQRIPVRAGSKVAPASPLASSFSKSEDSSSSSSGIQPEVTSRQAHTLARPSMPLLEKIKIPSDSGISGNSMDKEGSLAHSPVSVVDRPRPPSFILSLPTRDDIGMGVQVLERRPSAPNSGSNSSSRTASISGPASAGVGSPSAPGPSSAGPTADLSSEPPWAAMRWHERSSSTRSAASGGTSGAPSPTTTGPGRYPLGSASAMHFANNSSFSNLSFTTNNTSTSYGGTSTDTMGRSVSPSVSSSFRQNGRYTPSIAAPSSEREGSFVSAASTLGGSGSGVGGGGGSLSKNGGMGRRRSAQSGTGGADLAASSVRPGPVRRTTSHMHHSRAFSGSSTATRSTSTSAASEAEDQFHDAEEGIGRSMVNLGLAAPTADVLASNYAAMVAMMPVGPIRAGVSNRVAPPDIRRRVSVPSSPVAPDLVETDEEQEEVHDGDSDVESTSSLDSIDREVRRTVRASRQAHSAKRKAESMRRQELEAAERKEAEDAEVLKFFLRQPSPSLSGGAGGSRDMLFPPSDGRGSITRRASLNKRASIQSVLSGGNNGGSTGSGGIGSPASLSRSGSIRSGTGSSSAPHTPRILQHAASFAGKASPGLLKGKASKSSVGSESLNMWAPVDSASLVGSWSTPATRAASPSNANAKNTEDTPNASTYGSNVAFPPVPPVPSKHSQQQQADAAWMSKGNAGGGSSGKMSRLPGAGMLARMTGNNSGGVPSGTTSTNPTSNSGHGATLSTSLLARRRAESAASSLSGLSARTAALSLATTSDGEFGGDGYTSISYSTAGYEENGGSSFSRSVGAGSGAGAGAGPGIGGKKVGKSGLGRKSAPPTADSDQSMLSTLVLSPSKGMLPPLPSPTVPLTPSNPIAQYIRSERLTRIVTLKRHPFHGVKVSLADVGAKGGHPVVIFLGLGAVRYLIGLYDDIASAMGLRLICIDRWGLGKTDTVPEDQRGVLEWGIVVGEVLDQLGIGRFTILAHSAGAPYAMATVLRQPSSRVVGPVHLLAPWVSAQVESNWKWLKYVPDGVIRTAQAAEWKMQAWRLGKQPSMAYEGVGFDARSANTPNSSGAAAPNGSMAGSHRKSGEEAHSQGHSSGHGQRGSKDAPRSSMESISGAYATYSRVLDLNNTDAIGSISEEDLRNIGDINSASTLASASVSPAPSSFGGASSGGMGAGAAASLKSNGGRSGASGRNDSVMTAPPSPSSVYAEMTGGRWSGGGNGPASSSSHLPSPNLQLPETPMPRKLVKKKSSKLGSFFGTSAASSTSALSGKQREGSSSTTVLVGKGSVGPSVVRIGKGSSTPTDARLRTTSLSRLRYNPNPEEATMEHMDDRSSQSSRPRRQLRSASVTSLNAPSIRDKEVPALPADAHLRYSVASLPPSSTANSLYEVSDAVPERPLDGMRRSFSATMARPMLTSSNDSGLTSMPSNSHSSNSLRTLVRMSNGSASMRTLDESDRGSTYSGPTQSTPVFARTGLGIGLGIPLNTPASTIHEPQNSSLASLPEYVSGTPPSANTSAASRRSGASNTSSTSNQVPDLATALLRASHAESLKGGTADLMAILGRTSRPWGFTYTDVEHRIKVWHGDRDERISLSSAQWMEQEMKDCELIVVKGAGHGLMTNVMVVMEALESIDRHRRD
ncbi:hypothetical protein A4X13_0g6951 [Tilletia indica]|uniref:AB hydrolase-1 domain-containing protein n=1 Tax=Tilletia indica TaxID=43049 RepID=A0A177TIQ6_9BASI|nr:hypothetical protein A4X13_0g6951 [Tilletia indica]